MIDFIVIVSFVLTSW